MDVGAYLRELRLARNQDIASVAAQSCLAPVVVAAIEDGTRVATKDQVIRLVSCLDGEVSRALVVYLRALLLRAQEGGQHLDGQERIVGGIARLTSASFGIVAQKPCASLRNYIGSIVVRHGRLAGEGATERQLGSAGIVLVFDLSGGDSLQIIQGGLPIDEPADGVWILGVQKEPLAFRYGRTSRCVLVYFEHGAFCALTGIPAEELEGKILDARSVLGQEVRRTRDRLVDCPAAYSAVGIIERLFSSPPEVVPQEAETVRYAISRIGTPLESLWRDIGYSRKHMNGLFRKHAGSTPKYLQQIARFKTSLASAISTGGSVDWSDIAYRCGYSDQAHMVREFRRFAGVSPRAFFSSGNSCTEMLLEP